MTFTFPLLPIKRKEENCPKIVSEASRTMTITTAMTVSGLVMSCKTEEGESEIPCHHSSSYLGVFIFQFCGLCRCTKSRMSEVKNGDYSELFVWKQTLQYFSAAKTFVWNRSALWLISQIAKMMKALLKICRWLCFRNFFLSSFNWYFRLFWRFLLTCHG